MTLRPDPWRATGACALAFAAVFTGTPAPAQDATTSPLSILRSAPRVRVGEEGRPVPVAPPGAAAPVRPAAPMLDAAPEGPAAAVPSPTPRRMPEELVTFPPGATVPGAPDAAAPAATAPARTTDFPAVAEPPAFDPQAPRTIQAPRGAAPPEELEPLDSFGRGGRQPAQPEARRDGFFRGMIRSVPIVGDLVPPARATPALGQGRAAARVVPPGPPAEPGEPGEATFGFGMEAEPSGFEADEFGSPVDQFDGPATRGVRPAPAGPGFEPPPFTGPDSPAGAPPLAAPRGQSPMLFAPPDAEPVATPDGFSADPATGASPAVPQPAEAAPAVPPPATGFGAPATGESAAGQAPVAGFGTEPSPDVPVAIPPARTPAATPVPTPDAVSDILNPTPTPVPTPQTAAFTLDGPADGGPAATPAPAAPTADEPPPVGANDLLNPSPAAEPVEANRREFEDALAAAREGSHAVAAQMLRDYAANHAASQLAARALFLAALMEPDQRLAANAGRILANSYPESAYLRDLERRRPATLAAQASGAPGPAADAGPMGAASADPLAPTMDPAALREALREAGDPRLAPLGVRVEAAAVYIRQKDFASANTLLEASIEESRGTPREPAVLALLGEAQLGLDQPAEAVATLEELLEKYPDHAAAGPRARLNLGLACEAVGHYPRALAVYRQLVTIYAGSSESRAAAARIQDLDSLAP